MTDDDAADFVRLRVVTASSTRRVVTAQAIGAGAEGDDDGAERWDDAEVTQPLGLMAVPTQSATLEGYALRRGDEIVVNVIVDKGAEAQTVETGETRLYGAGADNHAAVIRIRANGDIEVTPKAGQSVVLAGGSLKNARVEDPLNVGTLVATAGPYPVLFTYVPGVAGPTPPAPPGGVALTGVIATSGGAPFVKS